MSGTDTRLRDLMDIAVGEPPASVSVSQVRRLARRRRTVHTITAASAAFCAAVAVLALSLAAPLFGHSSSPRPASTRRAGGLPHYYLQEQLSRHARRVVVRRTATGAVTATVSCPWAGAAVSSIAPVGDDAFFMACWRTREPSRGSAVVVGSRLYRFQLTSAGRVRGYSPVPGGVLPRQAPYGLTAAADGSEVAMITSTGRLPEVLVINTRNGAHAVWRETGQLFTAGISLSPNGRDLRFVTFSNRVGLMLPNIPEHFEVLQVSPASRGGRLSSARVLVHITSPESLPTGVLYARISPAGSVLTVAAVVTSARSRTYNVVVEQLSVPSGKAIRVLFRGRATSGFNAFAATSDPTGRYIILNYAARKGVSNGWLKHGHLVPLAPVRGTDIGYETW